MDVSCRAVGAVRGAPAAVRESAPPSRRSCFAACRKVPRRLHGKVLPSVEEALLRSSLNQTKRSSIAAPAALLLTGSSP